MHEEILSSEQKDLLPLISTFFPQFGLVWGTAIALHLGHRRSIDFDLFSFEDFKSNDVRDKIRSRYTIEQTLLDLYNQLSIVVNGVKITFYKYPFQIDFSEIFKDPIKIPDLKTLAAMKAFALGQRAKWKDYVDLYFIFKQISFKDVANGARELFLSEFNEKLFREQLAYFNDIDYSEQIEYMHGFETSDVTVKNSLKKLSLER